MPSLSRFRLSVAHLRNSTGTVDVGTFPNGSYRVLANLKLADTFAMREIKTASFGYAAVYASLSNYAKAHPAAGIYDNHGVQYSLIDIFHLMDISEGSSWREHILHEFARVIDSGFDGLHLDQYGYPKSAKRIDGSTLWLDEKGSGVDIPHSR